MRILVIDLPTLTLTCGYTVKEPLEVDLSGLSELSFWKLKYKLGVL